MKGKMRLQCQEFKLKEGKQSLDELVSLNKIFQLTW